MERGVKNLLLLNPPGTQLYLRDYFCSKVSQADYLNHPIDLVYLSGRLTALGEVHVVDAIVDRLGKRECLARIQAIGPEIIVGLVGSASCQEDLPFYRKLSAALKTRIILIGDVLLENRGSRLQELPFVEAFLHDFSTSDIVRYLEGKTRVANMTIREGAGVAALPIVREKAFFRLPLPRHDLFLDKPYRYPFVRSRRFATVLTEFGCPYRCNFCVMSTLGWKQRPVDNILEELDFLGSLGVKELLFLDQTFGIRRERTTLLLEEMIRHRYRFGWVCFVRPDILDRESLALMKKAGCHSLIMGLESGSQEVLQGALKDYSLEQVEEGFERARDLGLKRIATVILGLPEETGETFEKTMRFLSKVDPEFVSFNVAVPRMGTPLRKKALQLGLISDGLESMDQSGYPVAMPTLTLSRSEVANLRSRAVRDFYLRPGYLSKRLWDLSRSGSVQEAAIQIGQGASLLRNHLRNCSSQ